MFNSSLTSQRRDIASVSKKGWGIPKKCVCCFATLSKKCVCCFTTLSKNAYIATTKFFTYFWGSTKFQIEWCGLSGSGPAYLMSKAPFTSIVLPAHSTRLPHEQLHILSKALSISVILLADMTVAKYFFRMSSESTLDPRFFFSRTFSWNVILNGIYIWSILGKLWPLVCISIKLYSKISFK